MILTDAERLTLKLQKRPLADDPPWQFFGVSMSQLSIARHYGGLKFNGSDYVYDQTDDSLTRSDVLRAVMRIRREDAKAAKQAAEQDAMFDAADRREG